MARKKKVQMKEQLVEGTAVVPTVEKTNGIGEDIAQSDEMSYPQGSKPIPPGEYLLTGFVPAKK